VLKLLHYMDINVYEYVDDVTSMSCYRSIINGYLSIITK